MLLFCQRRDILASRAAQLSWLPLCCVRTPTISPKPDFNPLYHQTWTAPRQHAYCDDQTAACANAGGKVFAVWRPIIISEQDSRSLPDVELLQRLVAVTHSAQCWAVILSKGGHFSAAIFDLRPVPPSQHSKANAPLFKELAHKSYHRYVVRYAVMLS